MCGSTALTTCNSEILHTLSIASYRATSLPTPNTCSWQALRLPTWRYFRYKLPVCYRYIYATVLPLVMSTTSGQSWCKSLDWKTSNVNKYMPVVFCCSNTPTQGALLGLIIRRTRWMRGWASFSKDTDVVSRQFFSSLCRESKPDSGGVQSVICTCAIPVVFMYTERYRF